MYNYPGTFQQGQRFERERRRLCPRSPFLPMNFNFTEHDKEWTEAERRCKDKKNAYQIDVIEYRQKEQGKDFPVPPTVRKCFDGKESDYHQSMVLSRETVFSPTFHKDPGLRDLVRGNGFVAPWPEKTEMKYEGDDRISTDKLHARFLGVPRAISENGTCNWQQRTAVVPYLLDRFYPSFNPVDIFMRTHKIEELEVDDQEGQELIGKDLMGMLDQEDIW